MKNKSVVDTSSHNVQQKHSQATEEQIRVAKLSQINNREDSQDDKIKEVSDITRKPLDVVSIALHDCNYDTSLAIQNIFEGKYDEHQDEWQTTVTKKGKKSAPTSNHNDILNDKNESLDTFEENDQKSNTHKNNISRGGGTTGLKGRSGSRNRKSDDRNSPEEKWDTIGDKSDFSRDRERGFSDRGRSRGRGRGSSRGAGRGGRGGFGRGGSVRGARQPSRGTGRGAGNRRPRDNRRDENGFGEPSGSGSNSGFSEVTKDTETWITEEKTEDWGDEADDDKQLETEWSTGNWGDQEMPIQTESTTSGVDSLFSQKVNWAHVNGGTIEDNAWDEKESSTPPHVETGKYVPEEIDAAVICSIPTSATSAEVTSYQPTNDISRYITNSAASNQFPSSQQEGGLTSSLNERDYSSLTDSLQQNITNMPMISGITESHKLEQEQLRNPKVVQKAPKARKPPGKNVSLPSQPVVMPRSAQMVHDAEDQFAGLEFGSGPVSPRVPKNTNTSVSFISDLSNTESVEISIARQPVANIQEKQIIPQTSSQQELLPHALMSKPVAVSTQIETTKLSSEPVANDVTSSLSAFKSLDVNQGEVKPHYLGSPGRGLGHNMATEPIPFPSSTNLPSSPSSSNSSLDVFSRHSGLGTSVKMSTEPQQKLSSYHDKQVYNSHDQNINAEKILAEQKVLAEKQFIAEQQRVLAEQHQRETITEQRAFAEQKALAQQKLLASHRPKEDVRPDALANNLKDARKNVPDPRLVLSDAPGLQTKDSPSKNSANDNSNYTNKNHRSTNPRSISSPPGLSSSVYASNATKNTELLNQVQSSTGSNVTSKPQSKTSSAPPGMLHPNLLYAAGVQPGMLPAYQQLHGYNYEELLQLQRHMHLPQSPYHYDISTMYQQQTANAASREGIANYQQGDSKFARANEESTPANLHQAHQANAHVAASNMNPHQHQAYMNAAAGQIPYGFTYAYQPGVMPQAAGIYPTFTAPSVFQLNQAKGVVGTQYQSQYAQQQQQSFNTAKYSGAGSHEFSKGNFHSNASQTTLSKGNQGVNTSSDVSSVQGGASFKGQAYNDGKGFLGTSPSSQPTMTMHGQSPQHINSMNPYLLAQQQQQQQQQHSSLLAGQVSANQLGHQGSHDNRSGGHQGHQVSFTGNQQKREVKGNYHSYWSGSR